ncbi:MAG: hypothetical protein LCH70_03000 [Proteobacteria bacterium]|nr:hypothetical protein [Pseudomonadota bacterium]
MTKEEFVERRKRLARETPPFDRLAAAALFALAIGGIFASNHFSNLVVAFYLALLFVGSIGYLVYASIWSKGTGMLCVTCSRPMLKKAADVAISTGTCPHCRKSAFWPQA